MLYCTGSRNMAYQVHDPAAGRKDPCRDHPLQGVPWGVHGRVPWLSFYTMWMKMGSCNLFFVISVCNLNSYSLASSLKWQCSATANFSKKQKRWGHPLLVAPSCIPNKIKADRTYYVSWSLNGGTDQSASAFDGNRVKFWLNFWCGLKCEAFYSMCLGMVMDHDSSGLL